MFRSELEELLDKLPDEVALAEKQYLKARADKEQLFSKIKIRLRAENPGKTESEIKDMATVSDEYYPAVLQEIAFRETWKAREETLRVKKIELGKAI